MRGYVLDLLIAQGVASEVAGPTAWAVVAAVVIALAYLADLVARGVLVRVAHRLVAHTETDWDDQLARRGVFLRIAHFAPAMVIYSFAPTFGSAEIWIERFTLIYLMIVTIRVVDAGAETLVALYQRTEVSREKPIRGYVQVAMLGLYLIGAILAVSILVDRSPWGLLTGLGALSAILLLLFRDAILGFVAGVQIASLDMVRRGDWIEMAKHGIDGEVIDISLTTVKVQNWDKTIATVPTYAIVSESVKNWRGMSESGGRRIKRAVHIDISTIQFCDDALIERLRKIELLRPYLDERLEEISTYNREHEVDDAFEVNGRRLTNVGSYRAYIQAYLQSHPEIHHTGLTFLVRQLPPTEKGLPIEIYVFSRDQDWVRYEGIQSDIFDHVLAAAPYFDLRIYQAPSSRDVEAAGRALGAFPEARPA